MKFLQLVMLDEVKANAIANGDRTFVIIEDAKDINLGDIIHYSYADDDGVFARHPIVDNVYSVTYIEMIKEVGAIISIKPIMSWDSYLRSILHEAFVSDKRCKINYYDKQITECGKVCWYNSIRIMLKNSVGDLYREIADITAIAITTESDKEK